MVSDPNNPSKSLLDKVQRQLSSGHRQVQDDILQLQVSLKKRDWMSDWISRNSLSTVSEMQLPSDDFFKNEVMEEAEFASRWYVRFHDWCRNWIQRKNK